MRGLTVTVDLALVWSAGRLAHTLSIQRGSR